MKGANPATRRSSVLAALSGLAVLLALLGNDAVALQDDLARRRRDYDKQKKAVDKAKKVPKLGDAQLAAARAALRGPNPEEALRLMEEYRDIVYATRELLLAEVPNPEKKSGGFKQMEIHVRKTLNQLDDLIADAPLTLRDSFEALRTDLEKVDRLLIRDLFPRQPGAASGSRP